MATDSFRLDITADADGSAEGFTPPMESWFLYFIRILEDADDPVAVARGASTYTISVTDEETGQSLLVITSIVSGQVYPVKVPSMTPLGSLIGADYERWQTPGRIKVAIADAIEGNSFTAFIHRTTGDARQGIY